MRSAHALAVILGLFPISAVAQAMPNPIHIQQAGPQIYPKINSNGSFAYRSGPSSANFEGMTTVFRSSATSGEVSLADGSTLPAVCCDAIDFALGDSTALLLSLADGTNNSPASGARIRQPIARDFSVAQPPLLLQGSNRRREGAAVMEHYSSFVWSEHRSGQWDIVVSDNRTNPASWLVFDSGFDDRQPAASGPLIVWTSVNQFTGWGDRFKIMVKSLDDSLPPEVLDAGRFPSVSYPFVAYERTNGSSSSIVLYNHITGDSAELNTCSNATRPVVTSLGGIARVIYSCPDSFFWIDMAVPALGECTIGLGGLVNRPDENEPAQYDASGSWVIYSFYNGTGAPGDDGEFDLAVVSLDNLAVASQCPVGP